MSSLIITFLVFFAVIFLCGVFYYIYVTSENKKAQAERLKQAIDSQSISKAHDQLEEFTFKRKDKRLSTIPWLDELLKKLLSRHFARLLTLIEQSGLSIKVGEFLLITVLVGFIGALVFKMIFNIPFIGFAVSYLCFWWLNFLKNKRTDEFVGQMPQALDLLRGDLKAGLDIIASIKHIAEDSKPPLSDEFNKVIAEINLGVQVQDALNNLAQRMETMDVQMFCTGIVINRETGGNLAELVGRVAETIRERFRLKGTVKALTAEGKMSALLLLALPFVMFAILNGAAPDTYNPFLRDPTGQKIIGFCLVSMTIGHFMIQKITTLDV